MAIATYRDLSDQIKMWTNREDLSEKEISSFVYYAGAMANQLLRVVPMEHTALLEVTPHGHVSIPADLLELRSLTYSTGSDTPVALELLAWDQFVNHLGNPLLVNKDVRYFSRQGAYWFLAPEAKPGTFVTCHYYRSMPDINPKEQYNWLINLSPASYLYGSLHFAYSYLFDEARAEYWREKFTGELQRIQEMDDSAAHKGSSLTVRSRDFRTGELHGI